MPSIRRWSRGAFVVAAGFISFAYAQDDSSDVANHAWQADAIGHAQAMRHYRDADHATQTTPAVIPGFKIYPNDTGMLASFQPSGAANTAKNPFFQDLGSNQRTCFTCHQPQSGWTVNAADVRARFDASQGADPIFRLVDGATCPSDDVSTMAAKRQAYSLLLGKGLFRIGLGIPAGAEFRIAAVNDPYACNTTAATGLTSPTTGIVSVYRRPLPAANLGFLSAVMWDGREPSLASQAADATLGHAQSDHAPTAAQVQDIVDFESGLFAAQTFDDKVKDLTSDQASGGPVPLAKLLSAFYIGVNDPFGAGGTPFTPTIFNIFGPSWSDASKDKSVSANRAAVLRGQELFNTIPINITGVGGLNDATGQASIPGFCGTCHDTPNVGNHSVKAPLNIGIADAGALSPPGLDISGLPLFTVECMSGPLAGRTYTVTDLGRALISGHCADIGKMKGPILRGLAGRAPYFHNGAAATLADVVTFYDQRFGLGLSDQDKRDLAAFLATL